MVLGCLGAGQFGGEFWEGLGVFLGSGRREGELEIWCLQVCQPNFFLDPKSQVFFSSKSAGFNGEWEEEWVFVLGFWPQGKVVMEVVGSGECREVKVAVR